MRVAAFLLLALVALPLGAGTAAAHGEVEQQPGADLPRVLAIEPAVPGLALTVVEGGLRLRLDNDTGTVVEVLPQPGTPRSNEPSVASGTSAAWSDARVDAPAWTLPLLVGDLPATVSGDRIRPPPPESLPWWALTLSAALFTFALGAAAAEHGPRSRAARGVAVVTLLVVAAHVVHVLGSALVLAVPAGFATTLAAAGPGVACWALGLAGAALAAARHPLGLPACAAAGALATLLTVFDASAFHLAVLPFGWVFDVDRASTAITLGCGAGLFATGFAVLGHPAAMPAPPEPAALRGDRARAATDHPAQVSPGPEQA